MIKIQLNNETKSILHILTRKEWEEIPNDYKTDFVIDYSKSEIIDKTIKSAFLPGYGTTLFFENRHFLIIDDKKPLKKYAIWENHAVVGYCEIDEKPQEKQTDQTTQYIILVLTKQQIQKNIDSLRIWSEACPVQVRDADFLKGNYNIKEW